MDIPQAAKHSSINVSHWRPGITFGEFSEQKFEKYSQVSVGGPYA